jgi:REP element-mobilizing transposase RayT
MRHKYHYRRVLPHLQPEDKAFFITFVTAKRWHLPPDSRSVVLDAILRGKDRRFHLYGAVVMPDHVHLVLDPLGDEQGPFSLCQITQAIKGASAHRINGMLWRKGPVWQDESFDHVLRKEEGIATKVGYILLIR